MVALTRIEPVGSPLPNEAGLQADAVAIELQDRPLPTAAADPASEPAPSGTASSPASARTGELLLAQGGQTVQQSGGAGGSAPLTVTDVLVHGAPDAIVYSNSALLAGPNKNFALINVATNSYTHLINHTDRVVPGSEALQRALGSTAAITQIETITYGLDGRPARREDGIGTSWTIQRGAATGTFVLNVRGGNTNLSQRLPHGASVNIGFIGSPRLLQEWLDTIPQTGKAAPLLRALERASTTASAGGSQYGVAWRGTVQVDPRSGETYLELSGLRIPLKDLVASIETIAARNYGERSIAAINNEEAYLAGANPFQRAEDTRLRDPGGQPGAFVNHGDPVAAIAGDVLGLQEDLATSTDFEPIRTNAQARAFLEGGIDRSTRLSPADAARVPQFQGGDPPRVDPNPMSTQERSHLTRVLAHLDRYGVYFASPTIKQAAQESARQLGMQPLAREASQFVRDVFEGDFRRPQIVPGAGEQAVIDLLTGLNRYVAIFTTVLDAGGVADDVTPMRQSRAAQAGFAERVAADGGLLERLGLASGQVERTPGNEAFAIETVYRRLAPLVIRDGVTLSGEAVYQRLGTLDDATRTGLAQEVRARIDAATK